MAIQFDSNGFLVGERRLKEMAQGIVKTEDNTKQILEVLIGQFRNLEKQYRDQEKTSATSERVSLAGRKRSGKSLSDVINPSQPAVQQAKTTSKAVELLADQADKAADKISDAITAAEANEKAIEDKRRRYNKQINDNVAERERDANGRFIGKNGVNGGGGGGGGLGNAVKRFFGGMKDLTNGMKGQDGRGLDPTLDALGELKDLTAPITSVFGKMTTKAVGWMTGRRKKSKNESNIPEEQAKANKENAKSDKERNKLLRRLIDAVMRGGRGGISGLLGLLGGKKGKGVLGGLLGLGKGALRRIPLLGALLGAGSVAMNWGNASTKEKGKGIGSVAGTLAGGALGSLLGPIGTIGGAYLGNKIGGIFGEKIGEWVDDLKDADFATIFKTVLYDTFRSGKDFIKGLNPFKGSGGTAPSGISTKFKGSKSSGGFSGGGASGSYAGSDKVVSSKDRKNRQLMMYDALKKAGFSHEQALALGGEIGRENDYSDKMFSTHNDPAKDKNGNTITNAGALSWNGDRRTRFVKHMKDRGLIDAKGNMPKTQATLDAQAEFMKWEMENTHKKAGGNDFLGNPDRKAKDAAVPLAKYIGWARGQATIRGAKGTRVAFDSAKHERKINGYIDQGADMVASRGVAKIAPAKAATNTKPLPKTNRPTIKVPAITPALTKINDLPHNAVASSRPTDTNIGQNVADRGMAHIITGGIGRNSA